MKKPAYSKSTDHEHAVDQHRTFNSVFKRLFSRISSSSPSPSSFEKQADHENNHVLATTASVTRSSISPTAAAAAATAGSPRRSSEFERVFNFFDENGDGKISPSELQNYMKTVGEDLSAEDAAAVVESSDSDGDGMLGFDDFVKLIDVEGEEEKAKNLEEAFKMYATTTTSASVENGSSTSHHQQHCITPKSLRKMLKRLGEMKTVEECKSMIEKFDLDGDGVLTLEEFKLMMI